MDFNDHVHGHPTAEIAAVIYVANVLFQQSMSNKEKYLVCSYLCTDIFALHLDVSPCN